ncbi:Sugar phosphate isomerase/epimerase [Succinivibrio dextrinosolvens]|uniref:sugar phosphate isomerase/epimerase family protein n=1 Tax=Succinivibrio dextrinosolvens TaxID=83771 RepID=UPI0008E58981|nr:sugar phosphate isomerase/epimerase [Succinivibrio dextrinosolvens]SFS72207.1 Sugar phosphate isomerase/epimerase [Succinivibrio dextrinosolvens]
MKLGFVSAILDGYSYEEMMATAKKIGYQCVEVACWPEAKAERRYAGVSHINCEKVLQDESYAKHVLTVAKDNGVEISSLAFYPNTLDPDLKKRHDNVEHLKNVIRASHALGINMVTTFIGRDQTKNFEDNLLIVKEVWPEIMDLAKEQGVKVAIENCPMLFGPDQWPGGQNLMTTPHNWKKIFEILDYDNLGINYDPSHFVWQMIDYVEPVYEFKDRIFHVHFKDLKVIKSKLNQVGILAYPLDFMAPKLPGLGDVNFSRFVSALTDIGYNGYACVEVEDRAFEDSKERILDSLKLSYHYMRNFVI